MTTEEIVPEEDTRHHPDRTVIPGFVVDALVHVPFGSFPARVLRASTRPTTITSQSTRPPSTPRDPAAVVEYLERYVFRPPTFADYLDLFGGARLAAQQRKARELTR